VIAALSTAALTPAVIAPTAANTACAPVKPESPTGAPRSACRAGTSTTTTPGCASRCQHRHRHPRM